MVDERKEILGSGLIPDPERINTETGTYTATELQSRAEQFNASYDRDEWGYVSAGLDVGNSIYDVALSATIALGSEAEEGFDATKVDGLFDNVPAEFHKGIARSNSTVEAFAKRARVDEYLLNLDRLGASGWKGTAASLAAGTIDADAVLMPIKGGTLVGTAVARGLASAGVREGRLTSTVVGAAAGAEAGAVVSAVGSAIGTVTDPGDIPSTILQGMAFGSTIGGVFNVGSISPYAQMDIASKAHAEYVAARDNGFMPNRLVASGSVGAAQVRRVPTPSTLRESTVPWFDKAADDTNAINAMEVVRGLADSDTTNLESFIGRGAQQFQNWVDKGPLKSLYVSVSDMGVIGNKFAFDTLYHPGGIIDGSVPAAGYDAMYTQELSVPIQNHNALAMDYMNRPRSTIKDKVKNAFVRKENFEEFDRMVRLERETRYWNKGKGMDDVHPAVKEMADQMDAMYDQAVGILKGREGEISVLGAEDLEARPGFSSHLWTGESIKKYDQNSVIKAMTDAHWNVLPPERQMRTTREAVHKLVTAIVTRSKAMDEGIDTNLIGLLRDGGKEFLRDTLKNNKLSDKEVDSIIDAFVGNAEERAKPGFLKNRLEMDMRTPIPGTNAILLDLIEPDLYQSLHRYTRKVAGTAALARKGYQLGDKTSIIEAIKDEMVANGQRVDDPRIEDILETAFSYFAAGAIGKGVDPMIHAAMRVTRQSLLGSLGLTQMSELGNVIAMVGVEAVMATMPKEMRSLFDGKNTPLVQEFHDALVFMDRDHLLHDDQLALDIVGKGSVVQAEWLDSVYKTAAFGDKLAGHASLFYKAMSFQQRLALSSVQRKIYKVLNTDAELSPGTTRRLLDYGLDSNMVEMLQKYIKDGVIRYNKDGVYSDIRTRKLEDLRMGLDEWDPKDLQDYKLAMHVFVARAVQKNLAGETSYWLTKQFGQLLAQFRTFPLLAMQKQFLRNMRHADAQTASALLWNLAVAGAVFSVSETVKGRGDDLTTSKIAKGAISYSPTSGWLPMATDPLAEIMGLPELRMSKYGPPGRATDGIIPTPPVIPTLNRIGHIPGAAIGALNGVDRGEAVALSSIPIIGSMYGFSALFNHLKDTGGKARNTKEPVEIPEIDEEPALTEEAQ